MRVKKKEMLYSILLTSAIIACLLLAGCKKDEPVDHSIKGYAYASKGQYDQAIADFNKTNELNPQSPEAYNNRTVAYYGLKEYDKALQDVQKAQGLGFQVPAGFLNKLREDSGREKLIVDSHVPEMGIMQ